MTNDDDRFREFKTNPKFRKVQRAKGTRVEIDSRFSSKLNSDSGFNLKWKRDRRGRPVNSTQSENFNRFYQLKKEKSKILDEEKVAEEKDEKEEFDRIRGIGVSSSSESETDSEDEIIPKKKEEDMYDRTNKIVRSEDISHRLAVQNMDWDRVNSADLFVLMRSSCPPNGQILKVTIYPSTFGKERIESEQKFGPRLSDVTSEDLDQDEKLRLYQIERLKYFYAVVQTDSADTADAIYTDLDNQSYGESGVCVDLRFIPDEVSFAEDSPRLSKTYQTPDVCTEVPRNYEIPDFVTSALTRSKVDLTWDETDKRRTTLLRKGDFVEDQVSHLIASGSDSDRDSDEEKEKSASKWRAIFCGLPDENESEKSEDEEKEESEAGNGNVEFKIESNAVEDDSDNLLSDEDTSGPTKRRKKPEELVEEDSEDEKNSAELDLIMFDPEDEISGRKHFDTREEEKSKKQKKKKIKRKPKELTDGADLTDGRFSGRMIDEDEFAIDRTHPSYKPSKAMDDLHRRRHNKPRDHHLLPPTEFAKVESRKPERKRNQDQNDDIVRRLKMRANK